MGSVTVCSDKSLAGVILFGGSVGLAGVGSSIELPDGFIAPMETSSQGQISTGGAMMNLENEEVTVDMELLDRDGNLLATARVILAAMGHLASFVNQFEWDSPIDFSSFQGILRAAATGNIAATVIQTRPGQLATMPVAPK